MGNDSLCYMSRASVGTCDKGSALKSLMQGFFNDIKENIFFITINC